MWWLYIVLLVVFIYVLDHFLVDKRLLELGEKFNGPKRFPIIGNALYFFGKGPKGKKMEKYALSKWQSPEIFANPLGFVI